MATMRKNNVNANLVRTTEHMYDIAVSAVRMNGSTGEWFRTKGKDVWSQTRMSSFNHTLQNFSQMDYV